LIAKIKDFLNFVLDVIPLYLLSLWLPFIFGKSSCNHTLIFGIVQHVAKVLFAVVNIIADCCFEDGGNLALIQRKTLLYLAEILLHSLPFLDKASFLRALLLFELIEVSLSQNPLICPLSLAQSYVFFLNSLVVLRVMLVPNEVVGQHVWRIKGLLLV